MASPIVAAILSAIIPGLGQFYCGSLMRGLIIFIVALFLGSILAFIILIFPPVGLISGIIPLLYWLWNIYDAYTLA